MAALLQLRRAGRDLLGRLGHLYTELALINKPNKALPPLEFLS